MPNEKVTFTCAAESDPSGATLKYQWKVNGTIQTGINEKTFTYTIPDSSKDSSKEYKVTCDVTATKSGKTSAALTSNEIVLNVLRDYSVDISLGTSASSYTVGQSVTATAKVYKNGSAQSSYTNFTWTVNDPTSGNALASSLATITGTGATGTAVIKGISTTLGKNNEEQMSIKASIIIEGNVYSAEKTITAKTATAGNVTMAAGSGVNMNTTAMSQAINKALNNTAVTPSYVQFSAMYGGKLYKSSTSSTELGTTTSCYLVSSKSTDQKLADVYYKPASSTGDRHVEYRVFDSSSNVIATGKVVFDESVVSGIKITMLGDSFKDCGAYTEIADSYNNLGYVTFEAPEAATGRLYYNYSGNEGSEPVTAASKFYVNATSSQLDLNKLYFLPAADCAASLKVKYTAYSTGGTVINNGELTFAVTKKTSSTSFSDVTASLNLSWAADSVDFMANLGIITGTGGTRFSPNNSLIRGDLVLMLYRMAGKPQVIGVENPFEDVKPTDYYYDAVMWAYSKGVVSGTGEKTFSPKKNITRQQIAAILWRYAGQPAAAGSIASYSDSNKVDSYAVEAMKWAVGKGYITGTSTTTLTPAGNATRAQVAVMLHRFLTK